MVRATAGEWWCPLDGTGTWMGRKRRGEEIKQDWVKVENKSWMKVTFISLLFLGYSHSYSEISALLLFLISITTLNVSKKMTALQQQEQTCTSGCFKAREKWLWFKFKAAASCLRRTAEGMPAMYGPISARSMCGSTLARGLRPIRERPRSKSQTLLGILHVLSRGGKGTGAVRFFVAVLEVSDVYRALKLLTAVRLHVTVDGCGMKLCWWGLPYVCVTRSMPDFVIGAYHWFII